VFLAIGVFEKQRLKIAEKKKKKGKKKEETAAKQN